MAVRLATPLAVAKPQRAGPQRDGRRQTGHNELARPRGNHGLLIDPTQHVAYIGCEDNGKILRFDLDAKKVVASDAVGDGPDAGIRPNASPTVRRKRKWRLSVFDQAGKRLNKIGEFVLAERAHSVAVDADTHRVYFPLENVDGRPVLRIMEPAR